MPEVVATDLQPPVRSPTSFPSSELEITAGRRAFGMAQSLLSGSPIAPPQILQVGWHDSSVAEQGSFAVIGLSSGLDDLIGEIIRCDTGTRQVFAYVLQAADVPTPISLARRAFAAIYRLSVEFVPCYVAVIG